MKKRTAAKKCAFCQSEQDQSSAADLARAELDVEKHSLLQPNENQTVAAATAELNPKHASAALSHDPDIECLKSSLKAWASDCRVGSILSS